MFWGLIESKVHIPSGELNYLSFGKGQKKSASISEKDKSPRIIHDAKPEEN